MLDQIPPIPQFDRIIEQEIVSNLNDQRNKMVSFMAARVDAIENVGRKHYEIMKNGHKEIPSHN